MKKEIQQEKRIVPDIPEKIRIGTLVPVDTKVIGYIKSIMGLGFESFSLTFWKTIGNTDVKKLAEDIREVLDSSSIVISCVSVFGNPLKGDEEAKDTIRSWKELIRHAHLFGCNLVTGFAGRVADRPIPESIPVYKKVFGELGKIAHDCGVRLAFENCSMGGNWERGDWNIAHNPDAWELMFDALPDEHIGLQWEPCHQMVQLIDPIAQLRIWAPKIFHLHGKDASIYWDVIRQHGIQSPHPYAHHRTPGFGDTDWHQIISILRQHNYVGSIDIEGWHDPVYRGELEMTGQVHALQYLKFCRGGNFVPNPMFS